MTGARRLPAVPVIDDARPCKLTARGRAVLVTQVIHNYTWGGGWLAPGEPRPVRDWSGVELRWQGRRWGLVRTGRTA